MGPGHDRGSIRAPESAVDRPGVGTLADLTPESVPVRQMSHQTVIRTRAKATKVAATRTRAPTEIALSSASKRPWCRSSRSCSGASGRLHARAGPARPGSPPRYQAKSSPPRLCSVAHDGVRALGGAHGGRQRPRCWSPRCPPAARRGCRRPRPARRTAPRCSAPASSTRSGRVVPGGGVEAAHGALDLALGRDRVGRPPGLDPAPDHAERGPRVDPAGQRGRQLGDHLAERVDQVRGQVRPGGVAARPVQPDRAPGRRSR